MIRISVTSDQTQCRISVEDQGSGVPIEAIPRLFEKGATFSKLNGTGRGLYQCKKSIESWNGQIGYEPLAVGSRFTVILPLLQTGVLFVGLPKPSQPLWIIDDDPYIAKHLASAGYWVCGKAETFQSGRELLEQQRPENGFIIVDNRLDEGQLGTELLAHYPGRQGIALCTNDFDTLSLVKRAREIGVRILPKPLCIFAMSLRKR